MSKENFGELLQNHENNCVALGTAPTSTNIVMMDKSRKKLMDYVESLEKFKGQVPLNIASDIERMIIRQTSKD